MEKIVRKDSPILLRKFCRKRRKNMARLGKKESNENEKERKRE